jgi:hypothetical protein
MSDMPELDRLLEEHAVFKSNMEWYRRECWSVWLFRLLPCLFVIPVVLLVGPLGFLFLFLVFPLMRRVFPDPKLGDPFRRFRRE